MSSKQPALVALAIKILALGVLLTCLILLFVGKNLARYSALAEQKITDSEISVLPQSDAPLRISLLSHNAADPRTPEVTFQLMNVGEKPVRAYSIVQVTERDGERNASFLLTDGDPKIIVQPGQYITDSITYQPLTDARSHVTLSIDIVEFSDGTLWGPNARKSAQVLKGRRAGVRDAQSRITAAYKSGGLDAAIKALEIDSSDGGKKNSDSTEWDEGYRHGYSQATHRLRRLLDKSSRGQLEEELRRLPNN
jgi:hypothetical protein